MIHIQPEESVSVEAQVSIYALIGESISIEKPAWEQSGWLTLDPGSLPSGLYVVRVQSSGQRFIGKIFIP
jgi:hypothetical protein